MSTALERVADMVAERDQLIGSRRVVAQERVADAQRPEGERDPGLEATPGERRHLHAATAEVDHRAAVDREPRDRSHQRQARLVLARRAP